MGRGLSTGAAYHIFGRILQQAHVGSRAKWDFISIIIMLVTSKAGREIHKCPIEKLKNCDPLFLQIYNAYCIH